MRDVGSDLCVAEKTTVQIAAADQVAAEKVVARSCPQKRLRAYKYIKWIKILLKLLSKYSKYVKWYSMLLKPL